MDHVDEIKELRDDTFTFISNHSILFFFFVFLMAF